MQLFKKHHNWPSHVFWDGIRLAGLTTDFVITEPSVMVCRGYVVFAHRGDQPTLYNQFSPTDQERLAQCPIMVSTYVGYRRADTPEQLPPMPTGATTPPRFDDPSNRLTWIKGAKDGGNIRDLQQHYVTLQLAAEVHPLPAGAYRVEPWAFARTAVLPFKGRNDIVEVSMDTNQWPDETFGFFATEVRSLA